MIKEITQKMEHIYNAAKQSENKICNGCKYEWAFPSHIKCHGCARMYADNFEKGD